MSHTVLVTGAFGLVGSETVGQPWAAGRRVNVDATRYLLDAEWPDPTKGHA